MSQPCRHHAATAAAAPCAGCAQPFCEDCLVSVSGTNYCASCKGRAVGGLPVPTAGTIRCKEADQALGLAVLGVFILGPILAPLAIVRSIQARRRLAGDTRLHGDAQAAMATAIAIAALALYAVTLVSKLLVSVSSS